MPEANRSLTWAAPPQPSEPPARTAGRRGVADLSVRHDNVEGMDDILMLSGVVAFCTECRAETIFVPVECEGPGCEHCCTACDSAVFLVDLGSTQQGLATLAS